MKLSRRDLALLAPVIAGAQTPKPTLSTKVYKYEDLAVKPNGANEGRAVLDGKTHTGYPVELHITDLGPGMAPHAPHHHAHEEIVMLRFGQLDVTIQDVTTRVTAAAWSTSTRTRSTAGRIPDPTALSTSSSRWARI